MTKENKKDILNFICWAIIFIIAFFLFYVMCQNSLEVSKEVSCNNVTTFYKDDLLLDNYYVTCDNGKSYEIFDPLIYASIEEGKSYKLGINVEDIVRSAERVD